MKRLRRGFQILVIYLLSSCLPINRNTSDLHISDLTKPLETEVIVELEKDEFVYKADLIVSGKANGTFKINNWTFNGPEIDTTIFIGDWYGPDYQIQYVPLEVTTGELDIEVVFYTQR